MSRSILQPILDLAEEPELICSVKNLAPNWGKNEIPAQLSYKELKQLTDHASVLVNEFDNAKYKDVLKHSRARLVEMRYRRGDFTIESCRTSIKEAREAFGHFVNEMMEQFKAKRITDEGLLYMIGDCWLEDDAERERSEPEGKCEEEA